MGFVIRMKDNKNMSIRQAMFLEFYDMEITFDSAKNIFLSDIIQKCIQLECEDPRNNVWAIISSLSWMEFMLDFFPIWIACKCQKEVRFA